jgi:hypothetical protein
MTLSSMTPLKRSVSVVRQSIPRRTYMAISMIWSPTRQTRLVYEYRTGMDRISDLPSSSSIDFSVPLAHATFRGTTNVNPSADSRRTKSSDILGPCRAALVATRGGFLVAQIASVTTDREIKVDLTLNWASYGLGDSPLRSTSASAGVYARVSLNSVTLIYTYWQALALRLQQTLRIILLLSTSALYSLSSIGSR